MGDKKKLVILGFGCMPRDVYVSDGVFEGTDVWTMNDWFNFYPALKHPTRVYNLHKGYDGGRNVGSRKALHWEARYRNSGAEIVLLEDHGFENQIICNLEDYRDKMPDGSWTCSMCYMVSDAVEAGYEEIEFMGVLMATAGEYSYQIPGMLLMLDYAESKGVKIHATNREQWERLRPVIDWSAVHRIDVMYGEDDYRGKVLVDTSKVCIRQGLGAMISFDILEKD